MLSAEYIIALQSLPGFGPLSVRRICALAAQEDIHTPAEVHALIRQNTVSSAAGSTIDRDTFDRALFYARRILEDAEGWNIGVLTFQDAAFPAALLNAVNSSGKIAPALVLYYRGSLEALSLPGVALVGTRHPSPEGVEDGKYYGAALAEAGCNIVSGLALGCDAAGHRGALLHGGRTTAFLGHGLDTLYPRENIPLARSILEHGGLLMSEYPAGARILPRNFVARNRLQVALSRATLVIQSGAKGGTIHTGNMTLAAKKPLFCVRYDAPVEPDVCLGNARLVRAGGRYVERRHGEADILRAILP